MKLLSVSSEAFPLIKTGGLADVVGALPAALAPEGIEMRTLLPGYPAVMERIKGAKVAARVSALGVEARVLAVTEGGLDLFVLDAPALYDRPGGPYTDATGTDWPDNWHRFAALSFVAGEIAKGLVPGFVPDLVHAHDWQAGLVPAYLRFGGAHQPSVMTIHNIAFQGQFRADIFSQLGLPDAAHGIDGIEYYGDVGFLKGGMQLADAITTVSPTYAQEILHPEFGMGLEGVVAAKRDRVIGIVNGIDTTEWNPAQDPHLPAKYGPRRLPKRSANRAAVQDAFGLDDGPEPILCVISRLTWQKGMDVLADSLDDLVRAGAKLALLGSGDRGLEGALHAGAARHPGKIGVKIGYSEPMSHLLQGGADAILIPSRFEPCGLTQLYGLRYGCVPVVARTGGLNDTVVDANMAGVRAGVATGVQFTGVTRTALIGAVERTVALHAQPDIWQRIQVNGMRADVGWEQSAREYAALYRSLM
ncbi:starch synthase [Rubricella aquisinus]|uniref:Glycogen synthase n=1 Tax=Rubricella aquisinus TaxID=2028108 RepID=A0A840WP36_9RHOB|nr:glycogen synthase GlgA [Rubricella aquisinus]MBB5516819.1 starch synthase [Rubricella aquisinus]